jgi:hypothetical protein
MRFSSPAPAPSKYRPNTGTLGENKKGGGADYIGKLNMDGKDYWLSGVHAEKGADWWIVLSLENSETKQQLREVGRIGPNAKRTEDRHPNVRGAVTVAGRKWWIAGWQKDGKFGQFYALAATLAEDQGGIPVRAASQNRPLSSGPLAARPAPAPTPIDDSEVPF